MNVKGIWVSTVSVIFFMELPCLVSLKHNVYTLPCVLDNSFFTLVLYYHHKCPLICLLSTLTLTMTLRTKAWPWSAIYLLVSLLWGSNSTQICCIWANWCKIGNLLVQVSLHIYSRCTTLHFLESVITNSKHIIMEAYGPTYAWIIQEYPK